jgi:hypothetical protein
MAYKSILTILTETDDAAARSGRRDQHRFERR